ncbi:MAG: 3-dehydroquinate synthase, partial [Lachnospiraceae bacterium]|nr:3-dehydroquinate synthase [Lachnospiraceae bacterium]
KADKSHKICIVTDDRVAGLYLDEVRNELANYYNDVLIFTFPNGEANKTLSTVSDLYEHLITHHFERRDLLVALGGGVVGDLTGFAAATFLRGIDFIQIPTTLLSQVDSSIGGKTGVDFSSYKNMVGAFYMPKLVYIKTAVLKSLPPDQIASGMGEVIKYGLIQRADFFHFLKEAKDAIARLDDEAVAQVIETSCRCKKEVVEIDPKEQGIRAHLNFGHTIGHAIEKLSDFSLSHGECVGLGMIAASYLSMRRGNLSMDEYRSVIEMLHMYHMPTVVALAGVKADDVLAATKSDKKMSGDRIRFILLKEIGYAYIAEDVTDEQLREAIAVVVTDE